jgi:hypothetical protein
MDSSNGANHKNLIVILLVVIIFLSGAVAYLLVVNKAEAPASTAATPPVKTGQISPQSNLPAGTVPPAPKGAVYTNTEYGFKFNLPEGFEKYRAMVEKEPFEKGKSYVFIMLPTTYPNWVTENRQTHEKISGYESMFGVGVWDRAVWEKELNSKECKEDPYPACPYEPHVFGKTAKYVFEVDLGNGDPTPDLEQLELKIRANDVKVLKDGFSLIK